MAAKNAKDKLVFIEPDLSVAQIDYLASILQVRDSDGTAKSSDIASAAGVTRSTASTMLKLMKGAGLIDFRAYGPVSLTPRGEELAKNIHGMREKLKGLLTDVLGIDEETAQRTAACFKGTVHPAIPEQLELLRRFMSKNKKKWKKMTED